MKSDNVIFKDGYAMCFYGKPTELEIEFGGMLIERLSGRTRKSFDATRKVGFIQVGSAYSNFKLASRKKSHDERDHFIRTLLKEADGLNFIELNIKVDGTVYTTFAISKTDLRILFE